MTFLVVSGLGVLAFLKIVCDEIIVKHRALELRLEVEAQRAETRARENAARQGVETINAEASDVEAA